MTTAEFHYRLGQDLPRAPACADYPSSYGGAVRADLHLVAGRQLDRDEHRAHELMNGGT